MKILMVLSVLQVTSWPTSDEVRAKAEWASFDVKVSEHADCIKTVGIGLAKLAEPAEVVARATWTTCIPSWNDAQEQQHKAVQAYRKAHINAENDSDPAAFWADYWPRRKSELFDEILALVLRERRIKMIIEK